MNNKSAKNYCSTLVCLMIWLFDNHTSVIEDKFITELKASDVKDQTKKSKTRKELQSKFHRLLKIVSSEDGAMHNSPIKIAGEDRFHG